MIDKKRIDALREAYKRSFIEPADSKKEPILSIVTIYDAQTEAAWLDNFIDNLPELSGTFENDIEVCLVKVVKDKYTNEKPKPPHTRKGLHLSYYLVYLDEWDFAAARNAAKAAACGKWILSLDTDESLDQTEIVDLLTTLHTTPKEIGGYTVNICSPIGEGITFDTTKVTRVFRNLPNINWECSVHEQVHYSIGVAGLKISELPTTIFHAGYAVDNDTLLAKLERNLTMICGEYTKQKQSHFKLFMRDYLFKTMKSIQEVEQAVTNGVAYE